MITRTVFFFSLVFVALMTNLRTAAQTVIPDSIEVKGRAFSEGKEVYCGYITVSRDSQYKFQIPTDTAGNFSFKIPTDRNDTSKVIVEVRCRCQQPRCTWAVGTKAYGVEELATGITITTELFAQPISHCYLHVSEYFDPPGTMTLTREEINQ